MKTRPTKYKLPEKTNIKIVLCFVLAFIIQISAVAQDNVASTETTSLFSNVLFNVLLFVIFVLLLVIIAFAELVKAAGNYHGEQKNKTANSAIIKTLLTLFIIGASGSLFAQENAPITLQAHNTYWGLSPFTFYFLIAIILFEIAIAWVLYGSAIRLLGVKEAKQKAEAQKAKAAVKKSSFIEKINASVAIEQEEDILLDHNYDGIRELDNNLPPWWKYGFYITIIWALIYLIHFHVTKTGKLQLAEYETQQTKAKNDIEEYRKKAANLVDENNAALLTDNTSLASGKSIYMDNCSACHGRAGEGGVGPNLTDNYWVHSGGVKDIFKTIKYGFPEKGMKSWREDLGAKQILEVSSYIKSLNGTNPPNSKERQGELYEEEIANDSTHVSVKDTTRIVLTEK